MPNLKIFNNKIKKFKKTITVSGDKSISIRWVLLSSIAKGISEAKNLLMSEDVMAAINAIKKLGIRVKLNDNSCKIYGKGIDGYKYKKNLAATETKQTLQLQLLPFLVQLSKPSSPENHQMSSISPSRK